MKTRLQTLTIYSPSVISVDQNRTSIDQILRLEPKQGSRTPILSFLSAREPIYERTLPRIIILYDNLI
jgi:hypothetical protein